MTKQVNQLRVCAYARVSTDKDDQVNSYESQCRYFTEYIRQHTEWQFAGIYADEGISGTSIKKRDNFRRMIADAESGLIDLILTKEVSRFARNTVDTLTYTRELKRHGVYVCFLNDNINTKDNDGELRLSIMATIAQDESRKTSERVKWGQRRRMEQGVVFGRDLLGYAVREGKLFLKEDEAEIVRLIFHKYTDEGKGTHVIARELREAGIRPMRVQQWSNTVILRLLRNEKYVGDLCQKKTYTPDFLTHDKKYNRGSEEMVYIRDHHPDIAIIDRALWNRTQAELARRAPSPETKRKHSSRYWCSGKVVCGICGSRFSSRSKKLLNGETYQAWHCYQATRNGTLQSDQHGNQIGCAGKSINDRALRYLTAYAIRHITVDRAAIKQELMQTIQQAAGIPAKTIGRPKIENEIRRLKAKKIKIIDLFADGVISASDMKAQNEIYTAQISALTERLADAAEHIQSSEGKGIDACASRIDRLLDVDGDNEKILKELLDRAVIYSDGTADIYLQAIPFGIRLWYHTSGKMDRFTVHVSHFERIDPNVPFRNGYTDICQ